MKILDASLMFVWYDMIEIGEKPEEYREIKPYWLKRLIDFDPALYVNKNPISTYFEHPIPFESPALALSWDIEVSGVLRFKQFTHIRFRRGYTKTTMLFEIESISIGMGNPKWGAPKEKKYLSLNLVKEYARNKIQRPPPRHRRLGVWRIQQPYLR